LQQRIRSKNNYRYFVFSVFLCFFLTAQADSQRIIEYQYDEAGNIVSINSGRNLGPPVVTGIQPGFIHRDSRDVFTVTGVNLLDVDVETAVQGMSITSQINVSATQIQLSVAAAPDVPIGPADFTFSSRLGSAVESIVVAERTPVISTAPNPIVLAPNDQPAEVILAFDQPFATDQTFDVLIEEPDVATVAEQSVSLASGETEVIVNVSGRAIGSTSLEINQLSNFLALAIPVLVEDESFPPGTYTFDSKPLSVVVNLQGQYPSNSLFESKPLSVVVNLQGNYPADSLFESKPVGVVVNLQGQYPANSLFESRAVGATYGAWVDQVSPASALAGATVALTLDGVALDTVTAVSFVPDAGITQTGAFTVLPGGAQITLPISVAADAPAGSRVIRLTTPNGEVDTTPLFIIE